MAEVMLTIEAVILGYHVFESKWPTQLLGEGLLLFCQEKSTHDRLAVVVDREESARVVGHLLPEIARLSFILLNTMVETLGAESLRFESENAIAHVMNLQKIFNIYVTFSKLCQMFSGAGIVE